MLRHASRAAAFLLACTSLAAAQGPPSDRERMFVLVVGVEDYADPQVTDLAYAEDDAQAVHDFFAKDPRSPTRASRVKLLRGKQATRRGVLRAIRDHLIRQAVGPKDTAVLFFAGHGFSDANGVYLATVDTELSDLEYTSIRQEVLQKEWGKIGAGRRVLLLDACRSGGLKGLRGFGGVGKRMLPSVSEPKRSSAVVAATQANQLSREDTGAGHGVFTASLLDGLRGRADTSGEGSVTLGELAAYLTAQVPQRARAAGGNQTPAIRFVGDEALGRALVLSSGRGRSVDAAGSRLARVTAEREAAEKERRRAELRLQLAEARLKKLQGSTASERERAEAEARAAQAALREAKAAAARVLEEEQKRIEAERRAAKAEAENAELRRQLAELKGQKAEAEQARKAAEAARSRERALAARSSRAGWKAALQPEGDAWKRAEQVFVFNNGAEPETLDVHFLTGVPDSRLARALFEGLVGLHPETLAPVPGLAESWTLSPDSRVYTFKLRANAKWSDGRRLTAQHVLDSWRRALTSTTGCPYAYMLFPLENAEAFHKGKLRDFSRVGVAAKDPRTLEVKLGSPCPYFLEVLAFHTLAPVPTWAVEEHGAKWSQPRNLVCSGPFQLVEWLPNRQITLIPNEHYWDRQQVRLEKVVALPITNVDQAYELFRQHKVDWLNTVPQSKLAEVQRLPAYYSTPYLGSYFYRFNVREAPFDDPEVRRALSLALDRSAITQDVLKAGQIPATHLCPPLPAYEPPQGLGYDPARARKVLAAAGYPGGQGFPPVTLLYNTSEAHRQVALAVVQQWKRNLGITVALRHAEWRNYLAAVDQGKYQIARSGWIGDYADPNTFLEMFVTKGGNNRTGWSNARYDRLLAAAAKERRPQARTKLLWQAEQLLVREELPILPLYIYVNQGLLARKVQGWHGNVLDHHPLQYLWIEPAE